MNTQIFLVKSVFEQASFALGDKIIKNVQSWNLHAFKRKKSFLKKTSCKQF